MIISDFQIFKLKHYNDKVSLDIKELISLILYNRIAQLEKAGRYSEALPLVINRAVFLAGNTAKSSQEKIMVLGDPWKEMIDGLYNYGVRFIESEKVDAVMAWVELVNDRFPDPCWYELFSVSAKKRL